MATFRPCSSFAMLNIHYKRLSPKVVHIPWPVSQQRFRVLEYAVCRKIGS